MTFNKSQLDAKIFPEATKGEGARQLPPPAPPFLAPPMDSTRHVDRVSVAGVIWVLSLQWVGWRPFKGLNACSSTSTNQPEKKSFGNEKSW